MAFVADESAAPRRQSQVLAEILTGSLAPAMRAEGLRKVNRRLWFTTATGGWVLLGVDSDRRSTSNSPLRFDQEARLRPPAGWSLTADADADADVDEITRELLDYAQAAVSWGRDVCSDPRAAAELLLAEQNVWGEIHAISVLRHADRSHPLLPEIVQRLTDRWTLDPRPITLRPYLVTWRGAVGLPACDLPQMYTPLHQDWLIERYGSAQAAYLANGGHFYYPDGTESTTPPPGWLEAAPG